LLDAAERIAETEGAQALTVRRVADAVDTTTRAVYSVFGSKEALVVALGRRAFDLLRSEIEALPTTADPAADLVEAGVAVFRRFAVEHPALFEIGIRRLVPEASLSEGYRDAAMNALAGLTARVELLAVAGQLGGTSPRDAVRAFHGMCEGLAAMELRSLFPAGEEERIWRVALGALVRGFA
jgi:AcrR family transcriptional regulator